MTVNHLMQLQVTYSSLLNLSWLAEPSLLGRIECLFMRNLTTTNKTDQTIGVWHKPRLYFSIIAIYLFGLAAIAFIPVIGFIAYPPNTTHGSVALIGGYAVVALIYAGFVIMTALWLFMSEKPSSIPIIAVMALHTIFAVIFLANHIIYENFLEEFSTLQMKIYSVTLFSIIVIFPLSTFAMDVMLYLALRQRIRVV